MKTNLLAFCVVVSLVLSACGNKLQDESKEIHTTSSELPSIKRDALTIEKITDSIFMKNNFSVELYVQMEGKDELIKKENFDALNQDKVFSTFNIVRYDDGGLMYVVEMPNAHGEPYDNYYKSYYSPSGQLLKFQRISTFLIDGNSQFVENSISFFSSKGEIIEKTYNLVDLLHTGKDVSPEVANESPGRVAYNYYVTAKDFVAAHPFK